MPANGEKNDGYKVEQVWKPVSRVKRRMDLAVRSEKLKRER